MPSSRVLTKEDATIILQRFWQNVKVKAGISGVNNHHYYQQLLSVMDMRKPDYTLAAMMYGRVITTPKGMYPGLRERNPYVGVSAEYHRFDIHDSPITRIILEQWGYAASTNHIYIALINSAIGTIKTGLKALNWADQDYEIIDIPTERYPVRYLKILKISKLSNVGNSVLESRSRWDQLINLGFIASPWILATVATFGGFQHQSPTPIFCGVLTQNALKRQPTTVHGLKNSAAFIKLTLAHSSLLGRALYCLIAGMSHELESTEIIQRISLFLETAVLMHPYEHPHLPVFVGAIVHEISLLLIQFVIKNRAPYIHFQEYQELTKKETEALLKIDDGCFIALPAHSGMHANLIAVTLARCICEANLPDDPIIVKTVGYEYWEADPKQSKYVSLGITVDCDDARVVRISAGVIGDYSNGTFFAKDINETIRIESLLNSELEVIIIDITTADYNTLQLAPDVIEIIRHRFITLIFWESLQKFGLLHTDQAQYGRVFAWNPGTHWPQTIQAIQRDAQREMCIPDVQVGAYIFKTCYALLPRIRVQHFNNGEILRESALSRLSNKTVSVPLYNPFISLSAMNGLNTATLSLIANFFDSLDRTRESFGHFYTTMTGVSRISAGAENIVDAVILSFSIDYFLQYTHIQLHEQLIVASNALDMNNAREIILYCSLLKALLGNSVIETSSLPMEPIKQCAKNILNNHKRIRRLLNGSSQFMNDLHTLLGSRPTPATASPVMAYGFFPAAQGGNLSNDPIDERIPLLEPSKFGIPPAQKEVTPSIW